MSNYKKTNIDHLREIIKDDDTACEFLSAIEEEFQDLKNELTEAEDDLKNEELRADEANKALRNLEDAEPSWKEVDMGIGLVKYETNSARLQSTLEDFFSSLRQKHTGSGVLY